MSDLKRPSSILLTSLWPGWLRLDGWWCALELFIFTSKKRHGLCQWLKHTALCVFGGSEEIPFPEPTPELAHTHTSAGRRRNLSSDTRSRTCTPLLCPNYCEGREWWSITVTSATPAPLLAHKACDCSRRLRYTNKSGRKFGGNSKLYLPLGIYS